MPGVVQLDKAQLARDVAALQSSGAQGLVFSWDLRLMPFEHLGIVRDSLRPVL
ncbi:hypothetical protein ACFLYO_07360 [Chloroflexota bacterium]